MNPEEKKSLLERVFAATSTEETRRLYDEWASTYDTDMKINEFTAPRLVAEAVARGLKLNHISADLPLAGLNIVDAGCGTGTAGVELSRLGAKDVVGLDFSEGMLELARKTGVYGKLRIADLMEVLEEEDGKYDALTSSGTFTHGHLGPEPLPEFVRIVKIGGVVVFTVKESHWREKEFEKAIDKLVQENKVEVVERNLHNYRKNSEAGLVLILRKI